MFTGCTQINDAYHREEPYGLLLAKMPITTAAAELNKRLFRDGSDRQSASERRKTDRTTARASKSKAELKAHSTALDHMVDESARKDWDSGTLPLATQRVGGTITTYLNLIKHGATRHLH